MYNLDGISYEMFMLSMIYIIVMFIFLIMSKFWIKRKRKIKDLIMGLICMVLATGTIMYYSYVIKNPNIAVHEGFFLEEHRKRHSLTMWEYVFSNDKGLKPTFSIDVSTKKNIYPDSFDKKNKYRIYFEKRTNIIVKVELLQ